VVQNDTGSEVLITVFHQPAMSDEQYIADLGAVQRDLEHLKTILESLS
jgi:hypothetical protein